MSARRTVHSRSWSAVSPVSCSTSLDLTRRTEPPRTGSAPIFENGYHAQPVPSSLRMSHLRVAKLCGGSQRATLIFQRLSRLFSSFLSAVLSSVVKSLGYCWRIRLQACQGCRHASELGSLPSRASATGPPSSRSRSYNPEFANSVPSFARLSMSAFRRARKFRFWRSSDLPPILKACEAPRTQR